MTVFPIDNGSAAHLDRLASFPARPFLHHHPFRGTGITCLRALVAGGLVEEPPSDGGERRFRLAGDDGGPLRLSYDLGPKGNAAELRAFAHGLLQIAERDFQAALERSDTVVAGPARTLWASRNKGWLAAADVAEVNALLARLGELTSQPKADGREQLVSLAFVLAPTEARSKRRAPRTVENFD